MRTQCLLAIVALFGAVPASAQVVEPARVARGGLALPTLPQRAIRGTIPMTNVIQRAFAAGTRDSSGKPGPKYWQLWNDYTIRVRLDAADVGPVRDRADHHHQSQRQPAAADRHASRPEHLHRPGSPRSNGWNPGEFTDGFVFSKVAVDGVARRTSRPLPLVVVAAGAGVGGGGGGAAPSAPIVFGFTTTRGMITLPTPIPAHGQATSISNSPPRCPAASGRPPHLDALGGLAGPDDAVVPAHRRL